MTDVSVIIPVYNGEDYIEQALNSVLCQNFCGKIEVSIYNDGSSDATELIINHYKDKFLAKSIKLHVSSHNSTPKGVGFSKNKAIENSNGKYLCFLDADDFMHPDRIQKQYEASKIHPNAIIGSQFNRLPPESTHRFTKWANSISHTQLYSQIYTSNGPTLIMPTWFCSRQVFDKVGHFDEGGRGVPEDLIFFYRHLDVGGELFRVDDVLLTYRHHPAATTFSVLESTIWNIRLKRLQSNVLSKWNQFSIWNAGKQGRQFYRSLDEENREKVVCFCDVDSKKISSGYYTYEECEARPKPKVPIVHFSNVVLPVIICMKQDLTNGKFEDNLYSLNLTEGKDYIWFS